MENQRLYERVPFPFPIEQIVMHRSDYPRLSAEDEFIPGKGVNISVGGLSAESSYKVEPLAKVYLMFALPADTGTLKRIRCEGYVAHSNFDGKVCVFGICFSDLSAEDRSLIDAYIRQATGTGPTN